MTFEQKGITNRGKQIRKTDLTWFYEDTSNYGIFQCFCIPWLMNFQEHIFSKKVWWRWSQQTRLLTIQEVFECKFQCGTLQLFCHVDWILWVCRILFLGYSENVTLLNMFLLSFLWIVCGVTWTCSNQNIQWLISGHPLPHTHFQLPEIIAVISRTFWSWVFINIFKNHNAQLAFSHLN